MHFCNLMSILTVRLCHCPVLADQSTSELVLYTCRPYLQLFRPYWLLRCDLYKARLRVPVIQSFRSNGAYPDSLPEKGQIDVLKPVREATEQLIQQYARLHKKCDYLSIILLATTKTDQPGHPKCKHSTK